MVRVAETTLVAKITGADSMNDTARRFGIHATDLGMMWEDSSGRVLVVFGDTYGEGWGGSGAGPADGSDWRCNVLAYATDADLSAGLRFESVSARADGMAAELFGRDRGSEATVIPNSGTAVGDTHYLHYMSVKHWDGPGRWRTNHAGIAVSEDGGANWSRPPDAVWPNRRFRRDHPFQIGAFTHDPADPDHRYLFGTPNGRFGDARLARVSTSDLLAPRAYEYWTGREWVRGDEYAARPVFRGPVGEMSVLYNDHFGQWLAVHLDERRAAIVLRSAPAPTGPWSGGDVLVSGRDFPALYGGYLHPSSAHGSTLYFAMSQWDPYNVFWMSTELY